MPAVVAKELKSAKPIKVVTDAICHALEAERPKTRYPLVRLWYLGKFLPDRLLDKLLIKAMGLKTHSLKR